MTPDTFKEANHLMGAGGNPGTSDLPVCIAEYKQIPNIPFVVSRWKLTPEEIQRIQETGEMWIGIMGHGMPPIMPMAFHPFNELGYKPIDQ